MGDQSVQERTANWARIWTVLHPPLSWALGCGLLVFVTVSGAGNQAAEWYAVIGGLLGAPFLTLWKENRRKNGNGGNAQGAKK